MVDEHLRPLISALPSYVKDTIHLLQIIDGVQVTDRTILVSIDVETLYSSIPHKGLNCIQKILSQIIPSKKPFNKFILLALDFILRHNVFSFHGQYFLQVQGIAMGTCCSPGCANLYLREWEKTLSEDEDLALYLCHITMRHVYNKYSCVY